MGRKNYTLNCNSGSFIDIDGTLGQKWTSRPYKYKGKVIINAPNIGPTNIMTKNELIRYKGGTGKGGAISGLVISAFPQIQTESSWNNGWWFTKQWYHDNHKKLKALKNIEWKVTIDNEVFIFNNKSMGGKLNDSFASIGLYLVAHFYKIMVLLPYDIKIEHSGVPNLQPSSVTLPKNTIYGHSAVTFVYDPSLINICYNNATYTCGPKYGPLTLGPLGQRGWRDSYTWPFSYEPKQRSDPREAAQWKAMFKKYDESEHPPKGGGHYYHLLKPEAG